MLESLTATSKSNDFPSALGTKLSNIDRVPAGTLKNTVNITRRCENLDFDCQAKELTYREVQPRSADEASTIICTYPECGHTFQEGN
ncbi:hypothetical protein ACMFMF_006303 [Clarireedia jacksonii]